jgi:membrane protein implicated in regulation of membrane protease activity
MADLIQWWNLVYVLAFFFALLYAVLNAIGLATSQAADIDADADAHLDFDHDVGDMGVDHDVDVDAHVDLDHDIDVDAHVDVDHDMDVDAHADIDHDADLHVDADHDIHAEVAHAEPSFLEEALSFFGIGRVPLSFILMTFLSTFAFVGWAVNTVLKPVLRTELLFFPISCSAAVFCGLALTKLMAGTLGRWLKPVDTAAVRRSSLVGRIARAKLPITEQFGRAMLEDQYGSRHTVVCTVPEGAEPIAKGRTVLLVRFVPDVRRDRRHDGHYLVEPYDVPRSRASDDERRK